MMSLIVGITLLVFSVLLYLVLCWGARKSSQPAWMHGELVAMVHVPLLVSTFAFGLACLAKFAIQTIA